MKKSITALEEAKIELVNNLLDLEKELEEAWNYHPDNPDRLNAREMYEAALIGIKDLEEEIADIDEMINNIKKNR